MPRLAPEMLGLSQTQEWGVADHVYIEYADEVDGDELQRFIAYG